MQHNNVPRVSVVMPAYNASQYIGECIESILNQTFTNFEFLIVDDGSTDNTVEICKSYQDPRIRLICNPENKGVTYTNNKGLELAQAPLIAKIDADDVAMSDRLALQVEYMDAHLEAGAVATWIQPIDQHGKFLRGNWGKTPPQPDYLPWAILFKCPITHPSVMFRANLVRELGGYGKEEIFAQDYYLWSNMHRVKPIHILPKQLTHYRVHSGSITLTKAREQALCGYRISKNNMEILLGEPVDKISSYILHFAGNLFQTGYSAEEITMAIQLLEKIYNFYVKNYCIYPETKKNIDKEVRQMLQYLLLSMPVAQRIVYMSKPGFVRSILDIQYFIKGLCSWKNMAKKILNRPNKTIAVPLDS